MKTGIDYVTSKEKTCLDIGLATILTPGRKAAETIIKRLIVRSGCPDLPFIFERKRMGRNNTPFTIQKYTTLDPESGESLGNWAAKMRQLGLDELAQLGNIRLGEMSFTGPRPLDVPEYEATRDVLPSGLGDRWAAVIRTSRPGVVSSYGIHSHTLTSGSLDGPETRAELDIQDFMDASPLRDLKLASSFVGAALSRRLK